MYDIIIIGGGPAGLSAALTAKARNKNVILFGSGTEASSAYKAERIDNYLGMPGITGAEMLKSFTEHAALLGVEIMKGRVLQVLSMGDYFSLSVGDSIYETKAVILATGATKSGRIKGEKEFLGKGVSYCATCDGMLYRGKRVVVAGENEESGLDIRFLREICSDVIVVSEKDIIEIQGNTRVYAVETRSGTIECDGVFIIADSVPADSLIYGIEIKDGFIVTDKAMKTNIAGVFAAGDCAGKPFQISKAVGEGLVAALSAVSFTS